jgi:transcriptional regulator with XRE-family HTH domain
MTKRIIRTSNDLPGNHWIARQLPAGTSLRPYAEDEAISSLTSAAQDALNEAGLSRTEIARLLGTTKSYVSQVLNGSTNMTLRTLGALFWAAGRQVRAVQTVAVGGEVRPEAQPVLMLTTQSAASRAMTYSPDTASLQFINQFNSKSAPWSRMHQ